MLTGERAGLTRAPPFTTSAKRADMSDQALPAGTTLLLRGGRALTPAANWHDPPPADIAIAEDRIAGGAPGYRLADARGVEVIEAHDHLVLPGFVNAHYHSHDVLAKGTLE